MVIDDSQLVEVLKTETIKLKIDLIDFESVNLKVISNHTHHDTHVYLKINGKFFEIENLRRIKLPEIDADIDEIPTCEMEFFI